MPAAIYDVEIEQKASFLRSLVMTGGIFESGLTGFTFDAAIRREKESAVVLTFQTSFTSTSSGGTLFLIVDPSSTSALTIPRGYWDLFATRSSDGYVEKLLEGNVTVAQQVTP